MANKPRLYIKPSKRGTFTKASAERGMGVQEFADKVLANPYNYTEVIRKKAQFAKNATRLAGGKGGGQLPEYALGGNTYGISNAVEGVISKAGPWGAAIGAVAGMGNQLGESVGGNTGDIISGTFSPLKGLEVFKRGDVSAGKKALSLLAPGLGNMWAKDSIEKERKRAVERQNSLQRGQAMLANMDPQQQYAPVFQQGGSVEGENGGAVYATSSRYKPITPTT